MDQVMGQKLAERFGPSAARLRALLDRSATTDLPSTRIPIWLQLSVATMFILAVSTAILSYFVMERQKDKLYEQTIKLGMVGLNYFSSNAKIPMLNDDILELNTLINNAQTVDGHYYAFIIDNDQVIRAHTNHDKIDQHFEAFRNVEKISHRDKITYFQYTREDGERVLNLSSPIVFKDTKLGEVHVGLSIDFIQQLLLHERAVMAFSTLLIILVGMIGAVLFSLRFSKPISNLVRATSEISKGNYNHKVQIKRNDELGTLGGAFNRMGGELYRQSLVRETFGKYVGSDVLSLIEESPDKGWLKGRKTEASILFADIRGFTGYSELREPEEVVEQLNEFFAIATEIVMKHNGYVDKFIGDSLLAVFGAPVCDEYHSENCLRAAMDIQQELLKRAEQTNNALLGRVGIGIASGVVVAGNIGSQVKTEYTVIGDCVNVASYLNTLAGSGEIVIGNGVSKKLLHLVDVVQLPSQKVKGREEMVNVYKVVRVKKDV